MCAAVQRVRCTVFAGEMIATPFPDKAFTHYTDVEWGTDQTVLYGGGADSRIDVYTLVM